ncbi:MAG: DUF3368 domain-containing protein [Lewinellaceae bacterium]|nr:DUF3368 domain-containing protein [Saprospiraceae bacterium]MCB9331940.1 DUF3368 domain-containing protein [Lewinellaceae bacterium]
MVIVSDTSPISSLLKIGRLQILPAIYGQVIIPKQVADELQVLQKQGYDLVPVFEADWLVVQTPSPAPLLDKLRQEIDPGEAEAIALAIEIGADLLIIDEKSGRAIALREGIAITGLLGVLLEAKRCGHIPAIKPVLDDLVHLARFRIKPSLIQEIISLAGE